MSEKKEQDQHVQWAYENALQSKTDKLEARIKELEAKVKELEAQVVDVN